MYGTHVSITSSTDLNHSVLADQASKIRRSLMGRSIVLVGIMGVGKSTIGKRLSYYLDIPFVDADKEIERAAGMSIEDIFLQFGEESFRTGERKVMDRLLGEGQTILATGGGAFMDESIRDMIKSHGISLWLRADLEVLMSRVHHRTDRPLLNTADPATKMAELLEERTPIYGLADLTVESRMVNRDIIAGEVIDLLATSLPQIVLERGWK